MHSSSSLISILPSSLLSSSPHTKQLVSGSVLALLAITSIILSSRKRANKRAQAVGRRFVVTGAGGGIGKCVVVKLAKLGYRVWALDVNEAALQQLCVEAGPSVTAVPCDIGNSDAVEEFADMMIRDGGSLHGLINVAGIAQPGPVMGFGEAAMKKIFEINAFGTFRLVRTLLPAMLQSKSGASVINVTSVNGQVAWPWSGYYASVKAAVELFSESFRRESYGCGLNVRVTTVAPGPVLTPIMSLYTDQMIAWCQKNPTSHFHKHCLAAATRQEDARKMNFPQWLIAVTPESVADVIVNVVEQEYPPARIMIARPLFKVLYYLGKWLPTTWGDRLLMSL